MSSSWATASGPSARASASISRMRSANDGFFMDSAYVFCHILSTNVTPAGLSPAADALEVRESPSGERDLRVLALLARARKLVVPGEQQHDLVAVRVAVNAEQDFFPIARIRLPRCEHRRDLVGTVPQPELEQSLTELLAVLATADLDSL